VKKGRYEWWRLRKFSQEEEEAVSKAQQTTAEEAKKASTGEDVYTYVARNKVQHLLPQFLAKLESPCLSNDLYASDLGFFKETSFVIFDSNRNYTPSNKDIDRRLLFLSLSPQFDATIETQEQHREAAVLEFLLIPAIQPFLDLTQASSAWRGEKRLEFGLGGCKNWAQEGDNKVQFNSLEGPRVELTAITSQVWKFEAFVARQPDETHSLNFGNLPHPKVDNETLELKSWVVEGEDRISQERRVAMREVEKEQDTLWLTAGEEGGEQQGSVGVNVSEREFRLSFFRLEQGHTSMGEASTSCFHADGKDHLSWDRHGHVIIHFVFTHDESEEQGIRRFPSPPSPTTSSQTQHPPLHNRWRV